MLQARPRTWPRGPYFLLTVGDSARLLASLSLSSHWYSNQSHSSLCQDRDSDGHCQWQRAVTASGQCLFQVTLPADLQRLAQQLSIITKDLSSEITNGGTRWRQRRAREPVGGSCPKRDEN